MKTVDVNCDLGESFGRYTLGRDADVLKEVTSANVACGFHAGDPLVMRQTVRLAREHGVSVGAHPGFPDLQGFGRRMLDASAEEVYAMVVYQIGALAAFADAEGVQLQHVKPHGALYNAAGADRELADAVAAAVKDVDSSLVLYGLSGSELVRAGEAAGLYTANEVFADRAYNPDGSLVGRKDPRAMITDEEEAVKRVIRMVTEAKVEAVDGTDIERPADTICVHGDEPEALAFASHLRLALIDAGLEIASPLGGSRS
ncbi:LamB/YcsF family protein [Salsuginibacillus kocurii]|uniref:LamB/YcsF family protein n=1 Tax=Salsuginibacillus kocurii TaxID=427078 RepID=UPI000362B594|nr:5-oxoprolinase subunit PxpA [Salsuginibacillus kocurii]